MIAIILVMRRRPHENVSAFSLALFCILTIFISYRLATARTVFCPGAQLGQQSPRDRYIAQFRALGLDNDQMSRLERILATAETKARLAQDANEVRAIFKHLKFEEIPSILRDDQRLAYHQVLASRLARRTMQY